VPQMWHWYVPHWRRLGRQEQERKRLEALAQISPLAPLNMRRGQKIFFGAIIFDICVM